MIVRYCLSPAVKPSAVHDEIRYGEKKGFLFSLLVVAYEITKIKSYANKDLVQISSVNYNIK